VDIEWDPAKAASNLTKHGIRFSDVEVAFMMTKLCRCQTVYRWVRSVFFWWGRMRWDGL
jgi:uncharacterized DUF497 family protein